MIFLDSFRNIVNYIKNLKPVIFFPDFSFVIVKITYNFVIICFIA